MTPPTTHDWSTWFADRTFSSDWSSHNFDTWASLFADVRHRPLDVLEIGSWEGRSALFWLHWFPACSLTCVDTFGGGAEHVTDAAWSAELPHVESRFRHNTAEFADRVRLITDGSRSALRSLAAEGAGFDLVYVDGSHESQDVLDDATGSWALLRRGGWLVLDDYEWSGFDDADRTPKPGIDAFLEAHAGEIVEVHRGWQIVVQRVGPR